MKRELKSQIRADRAAARGARPPRVRAFDEEAAWKAILARDASRDGSFVFGVRSTGIYCRPSCPARRPRRDRVEFFASPRLAEEAGYRACLRCAPRTEGGGRAAKCVYAALEYLDERLDENVTLAQLAAAAKMSPSHLQKVFTRHVGASPKQYVQSRRAERFRRRLKEGATVIDAAFDAGYGSESRAYAHSEERLGMTPGAYRRGAPKIRIRYGVGDCVLGRLLVGVTGRGVCAVMLGASDAPLVRALAAEFPAALRERDDRALAAWIASVAALAAGGPARDDLAIDAPGTEFERRVWEALRAIPRGETRTYGEIARAIGSPGAARAVGSACGRNRVALLIPCHRAVPADGTTGGFRWGSGRKRRLLEEERGTD